MPNLLAKAFGVATDQITGPSWLRSPDSMNYYTIIATMPGDTTIAEFQKMLQNLLIDRFHLVFRRETRNFPGYLLTVDKGGPRFKEVIPNQDNAPGPRTSSNVSRGGLTRTEYRERTMAEFVSNLGFLIGSSLGKSVLDGKPQPRVIDKTGLHGKYTFALEYYNASLSGRANFSSSNGPPPVASESDGGPNIIDAIRVQLGLRLVKTAEIPLDMIVVERIEKVPTAN